ncbi:MAG: tetratricopeptide repeat protein [Acidobacteriota bacterium]|nr:tetratricopeptide repeat protein [Acidobacteriota bacterium]
MAVQREKLVRNAEKLVSRGKVEAAIREYRKLLAEQPKDTNTLNRVGDLYARIHRIDEAVRLFTQIAGQYTDEGFFVKAIAIYKKIIKLDPTRLSVYERLADLYHRQGLVNEARTQYQVLADYYVNQENSASASSIYQRMVELEPEDPSHRAKLAELYHQQQLVDKAMEQYRSIADIMLSHNQVPQAEQVFLRALDVSAEDLGFVENAAARLRKAGALDAARRVVEAAAQRNPAAKELLEPEEEAPADQSPVPEQVLDSADEFLGDDAELMQALRDADEAVGETPAQQPTAGGDDLVMDWSEEESESLVRPPADVLERPEPGFGFDGEGEEAGAPGGGEQQTFELDLDELEDLAASGDEAVAETTEADFDFGGGLGGGLEDEDLGLEEDLDLEVSEPAANKPVAGAINEDYLSEAEVLAKYGLREKALERVQQVLATHPEHAGAHRILVQLYLENDEKDSALQVAERLGVQPGAQETEAWSQVLEMLAEAQVSFQAPPPVAAEDDLDFLESAPAAGTSLAEEAAEPPPAEPSPAEDGGFQDLDFSDLEAPAEAAPTEAEPVQEASFEEASEAPEQELYLDDLEAPSFEEPSFEAPAEEPAEQPSGFSLGLGDLDELEDEEWGEQQEAVAPEGAAPEPGMEMPEQATDWAADAAFGDLPSEPAVEYGGELTAEAPETEPAAFEEPAFEEPAFEEPAFEEPLAEESASEEPAVAEPGEEPAAASPAPSSKPLSADSSKRINQLLESLLDDVPAPRKKKRRKSQDSEVERILGMAAKKPARPPSPEQPVPESPLPEASATEAPPADESPEAEAAPPTAVAPTEEEPAAALADGVVSEPEDAGPGVESAGDESAGVESAAEEAKADQGPVEVQIGVPKSEDEELEDHSDIEDALSFMEPASGALPPPVAASAAEDIVDLDDTGTSWLDEVSARREAQPESDDQLFDEEESFFDLGAELEEELSVSDAVGTEPAEEQSLEEIVEGFKQGVAEALSAEDYETHFDLGIAYREMGLLDEAIGEFQIAAKSPVHLVQCCSMLGICFLEKGLPELAVKWYTQGLKTPDISEEDTLALLYDLGEVYLTTGDTANAHKAFVEVYGINTNFRDIASRVAETRPA